MFRNFSLLYLICGFASASSGSLPLPSLSNTATFGAYISSLDKFDSNTGTFDAHLWLWSQSPKNLEPILSHLNYIGAESITRDPQPTTFEGNYRRESIALQGTFNINWDMRNFPFDTHILQIPIEHLTLDAQALRLRGNSVTTEPDVVPEGWILRDLRMITKQHKYPTNFYNLDKATPDIYDTVIIEIKIQRHGIWEFVRLVTGAELAALFAFLTFMPALSHSDKLEVRMGMLAGALFAVIANELSAGSIIDTTYVTLIDLIHLSTMVVICAATLLSFWPFSRVAIENNSQDTSIVWRPRAGALLLSIYLAVQVTLIAHAALAGGT